MLAVRAEHNRALKQIPTFLPKRSRGETITISVPVHRHLEVMFT